MNGFDLSISSFVNGFAHRSLRFDEFVVFVSRNNLFKGGVVIGLIWWLWFQDGDIRRKREALLAAMIASFPALAVARILSWVLFRPRPFNEAQFLFRVPYGISAARWEGLSSFPSDHAVLFFALATGIFFCLATSGLVHVRLRLNSYLPTPSFYRGALYDRHSCGCCHWNIHDVAGKSSGYPKSPTELGVAVVGCQAGTS